eukprot:gb/GECH01009064.1/.p1 GENE.gb/GECH01009064.1/~~gb/GECH01009064.1/.p1  ORF type:complete len:533 (+),score=107.34 gb/GECH01009064.1/:1-1599(+)
MFEMQDYEVLPFVIEKLAALHSVLGSYKNEMYCSVSQTKDKLFHEIKTLKTSAIKHQGIHCVYGLGICPQEWKIFYLRELKRFPKARKFAKAQCFKKMMHEYEEKLPQLPNDKKYLIYDPYEEEKPSEAEDEPYDEDMEWYLDYPKYKKVVPYSNMDTFSVSIQFSKTENYETSYTQFDTNDNIHAQVNWNASWLQSFIIGENKQDDEELKIKEHIWGNIELMLFLSIDGQQYNRKGSPLGAIHIDKSGYIPDSFEFIAHNGKEHKYKKKIPFTEQDVIPQYLRRAMQDMNIENGEHSIEYKLCFRFIANEVYPQRTLRGLPDFDSLCSKPLAIGKFFLEIKETPKLNIILPESKDGNDIGKLEEKQINQVEKNLSDFLISHPDSILSQDGRQVSIVKIGFFSPLEPKIYTENFEKHVKDCGPIINASGGQTYGMRDNIIVEQVKRCAFLGMTFQACVHRSPKDGWEREDLCYITGRALVRNPDAPELPTQIPSFPYKFVGVDEFEDQRFSIKMDLIPEEILKQNKINRPTI